jgi:short-subunit dehydrogenase
MRDYAVTAIPIIADVTAPDAPQVIDRALAARSHYLDCLVNNAGLGLSGSFHADTAPAIEQLLAVNVCALTRLMHHALGQMRARGRGGILNVASLGGYVPGPNQAAYYASKAYVISLTEAVAHEVRGEGVRIAVVAPGPVETGFHHAMGAESSLYRILVPSLAPERVARSAYRGFAMGRRVIVPGLLPSMASWLVRILPHPLTVPIVGALLAPGAGKPKIDAHRDD